MNYDYRLIFLIFALLVLNASHTEQRISWWFIATQVSALWATYFFFGTTGPIPVLLAFLGNFCQLVLALYLIGVIYRTLQVSYGLSEAQQSTKQWILRKAGK
jgi:Zn-dependent protease with chaperone function